MTASPYTPYRVSWNFTQRCERPTFGAPAGRLQSKFRDSFRREQRPCRTDVDDEIELHMKRRARSADGKSFMGCAGRFPSPAAWAEARRSGALPTAPGIAPLRNTPAAELEVFRGRAISLLAIAGLARLPQATLPVGTLDGCPVGLSLVGPRGSDLALLAFARSLRVTAAVGAR